MKLSCLQENLKRGLSTVSHAVAGKSPLPVLSNILLATDGGRLKLAATDLEIGITCWIGARVEENGAITVPAKLFTDVINNLPNDKVTLTLDARTQSLKVECGRFTSNIKGIEADEFPPIPTIDDREPTVKLPPDILRHAIDQVAFAAANDESRPVLTGVLMRLHDTMVVLAAADGYRLATRTIAVPVGAINPAPESNEFIIPARALSELARTLGDTNADVSITATASGGQVLFHTENVDLVSRLIDGKFPDFEQAGLAHVTRRTRRTRGSHRPRRTWPGRKPQPRAGAGDGRGGVGAAAGAMAGKYRHGRDRTLAGSRRVARCHRSGGGLVCAGLPVAGRAGC
ncbi:MAG: DNA polymerase III subunit beta [Blastochloris sp.]|nr:DNA polymerase III subunit beta [Blastochloris sp.]